MVSVTEPGPIRGLGRIPVAELHIVRYTPLHLRLLELIIAYQGG
jgi:hypothetical protein